MSHDHKAYCNEYYVKNRLAILLRKKEYHKANPGISTEKGRRQRQFNLDSWKGFIPEVTQCQMCGVDIYFGGKDRNRAIHFDHRHGDGHNFRTPFQFLVRGRRTPAREAQWKSFDFGMLCQVCNWRLPTRDRDKFIKDAVKYVTGRTL
jgi:hypothetical protein